MNEGNKMSEVFQAIVGMNEQIEHGALADVTHPDEIIDDFLDMQVPRLYDKDTQLGSLLKGDAELVAQGFRSETGDDPNLMKLVGFRLAADFLKLHPTQVLEDSNLTEKQIEHAAIQMDEMWNSIITGDSRYFANQGEADNFSSGVENKMRVYQNGGLLHQDLDVVKEKLGN